MSKILRVLIVEDSEDDTLLLVRELQKAGYEVIFQRVDTAEAMAAALDEQKWDIVISDYVMPKFSGLSALKLVQERGADLPYIIVSGNIGEDIAVEAMKAGAHDYIMKDNLKRLIPAIDRELRDAKVRRKRRKAEKAFGAEHAFRKALEECMIAGIAAIDLNYQLIYANRAFCQMVGWSEGELAGLKPPFPDWPPEEMETITSLFQKVISGKAPPTGKVARLMRRSGERFWALIAPAPLTDDQGKTTGWVASFYDITEQKRAENEIRNLSRLLMEAAEKERKRIARDLHDECGGVLSVLNLGMETLHDNIPEEFENQRKKCSELIRLTRQLVDTIGNIMHQLRPEMLDDLGLIPTLQWDIWDFTVQKPDVKVDFNVLGLKKRLDPQMEIALYRVFQESLHNILKHSGAKCVDVCLTCSYPRVILTVRDDGVGFEPDTKAMPSEGEKSRLGLLGMRERLASLGGTLDIKSERGKGTMIRAELPIAERGPNE